MWLSALVDKLSRVCPNFTATAVPGFTGDGSGLTGIGSNGLNSNLLQRATFTLTTANIEAMHGTPVTVLAAPGAGLTLIIDQILVETKPGGTQFTSGGLITFEYHGTSILAHGAGDGVAAAVMNSAASTVNQLSPVQAVIQPPANTGIDITNATGAFATGNGGAIVTMFYSVLTD